MEGSISFSDKGLYLSKDKLPVIFWLQQKEEWVK